MAAVCHKRAVWKRVSRLTFGLMIPQRKHGVDTPRPNRGTAVEGHSDRTDLDIALMFGFEDDAVIVGGLRVLNFAEGETVHRP